MSSPSEIETVVVGAGPAGLAAVRRLAMAGPEMVSGRQSATAALRAWQTEALA
jgi:cation diffusion facilitator CzcD-associated flavoprotein CzcO